MSLSRLPAAVLLAAAVLTGPVPARAAAAPEWASPGYSAADTYYNPDEPLINAASIDSVRRRWTAALARAGERCAGAAVPVVSGGRVFVPEETGIAAFQAGTGRLSWRFGWKFPEDESTPIVTVAGGLLLVGNQGCQSQSDPNGTVRALSVSSGRLVWTAQLQFPVQSMVVDRGIAVVSGESASDTPTVAGLRVGDGVQSWALADHLSSGVSAGGRVLVSRVLMSRAGTAATSAVAVGTGRAVWTKPYAWDGVAATPAGDRFYVSDSHQAMVCVDAATGAVEWTAARRASTLVAADGRRVYRGVTNGVEALDARTGRRQWAAAFAGGTGQPVRAGGLLYTTVGAGAPLGILRAADGHRASAGTRFGAGLGGNVVVSGGWIYAIKGNTVSGYAR